MANITMCSSLHNKCCSIPDERRLPLNKGDSYTIAYVIFRAHHAIVLFRHDVPVGIRYRTKHGVADGTINPLASHRDRLAFVKCSFILMKDEPEHWYNQYWL